MGAKDLELSLDLFPQESREDLEKRIKDIFLNNSRISIKNSLGLILPKRMVEYIILSEI